ncbi:hypothetical protein PMAYCL1PPCAC_03682, partial [Pristionchus mayeri]
RMALVLVYGIPGAGKTSLCDRLRLIDRSIHVWSFDDTPKVEGEVAKDWRNRAQGRAIEGIQNDPEAVHLIDNVFYFQSMRRPFEKLARNIGMEYGTIFVEVRYKVGVDHGRTLKESVEVAVERDHNFSSSLSNGLLSQMVYRSADPLSGTQIVRWINELKQRGLEKQRELANEVEESLQDINSTPHSMHSIIQETDLQARIIIAQLCQGGADGRVLSDVKKSILEETRKEGQRMDEGEMRARFEQELRRR